MVARLLAILLVGGSAAALSYPTELVEVHYGPGAGYGQDHVPENILGPPDPAASPQAPCADPAQLLSLGSEGWIVLRFEAGIVDGPGPDFSIYENVLQHGVDPPLYFRETGIVALSGDGVEWTEIPFDAQTGQGLAGWWPTQGSQEDPDWQSGGGDPFDLAWAGLAGASYLRISDAGPRVADGGSSFDLDAVRVWHDETSALEPVPRTPRLALEAWPNPCNGVLSLRRASAEPARLRVRDLAGRLLTESSVAGREVALDTAGLPSGLLLVEIAGAGVDRVRVLHVK